MKWRCMIFFAVGAEIFFRASAMDTNDWAFLDNGEVKLGVKKIYGAGIGWFSASGSERNLINDWDTGRLIQQSYYGEADGSFWDKQPWTWNPVQGGDWRGHRAKVLELRITTASLYAKTQPRHWASGAELPDVTMEEWIQLDGKIARIHFRMTYSGTESHPAHDQEIPAFFAQPDLGTLVIYDGANPWSGAPVSRSQPGWPNESRNLSESWAAFVDTNGFGVGAFVPVADRLTCYRYGDGRADHGACSYFAPLVKIAITPGKIFDYDVFLTFGQSTEIRERFRWIKTEIAAGKIAPISAMPIKSDEQSKNEPLNFQLCTNLEQK